MVSRTQLVSAMLSLDNIDDNVYRSDGPHIGGVVGPNRLFGGYIAAQVYEAARSYKNKINDESMIFSMHYNFVSAGDPRKLIDMKISVFDNVYAVDVYHENKKIGLAHIKMDNKLMKSPKYNYATPSVASIPDIEKSISPNVTDKEREKFDMLYRNLIFEVRPLHIHSPPSPGDHRVIFFARLTPDCIDYVKEDGGMVVVVALSDFFVLQSVQNAMVQNGFKMTTGASLHHKIHFHQEKTEATQWFLVETRTEIATGHKAKIFGTIFDSNKNCVISFIQEAYVVPQEIERKDSKL